MTLFSALPIWDGGRAVGAVEVSQSTTRLFRALDQTRLGVFKVFLASVAVAVVLSLLVSTTFVRPLRGLRDESRAILDRRGRLRGHFGGSRRRDEIGELARALEELTRRLEDHARFTESFAADLGHELKNPLASIRSATEILAEVDTAAERRRFLALVQREVARMEHLVTGSRELARIDAGIETEERRPVELNGFLAGIVEGYRLRAGSGPGIAFAPAPEPLSTLGVPERLTAVFENILDNARSFSPPAGTVRLHLARESALGSRRRHRRAARASAGQRGVDLLAVLQLPPRPGEERRRAHRARPRARESDRRGLWRLGRRRHLSGRRHRGHGSPAARLTSRRRPVGWLTMIGSSRRSLCSAPLS